MKKNGFTLIELILVIIILGVLAAFTIPQMAKYQQRQEFLRGVDELIDDLKTAQIKAVSSVQDETQDCSGEQKIKRFYVSQIDSSTYEVGRDFGSVCGATRYSALYRNQLASPTTITAWPQTIYFELPNAKLVDSDGNRRTSPITLTLAYPGFSSYNVVIEPSGRIYRQ